MFRYRLSAFSTWRALRVVLLGSALALASCSTPASPTIGTISEQGLAGPWRLEVLQSSGFPALLPPANATYTLTFFGGFVSARADCTTCDTGFTLVGDSLTVASIFSCSAFCSLDSFALQYRTILAGQSTVGVLGPRMSLVSGRGRLVFTR